MITLAVSKASCPAGDSEDHRESETEPEDTGGKDRKEKTLITDGAVMLTANLRYIVQEQVTGAEWHQSHF